MISPTKLSSTLVNSAKVANLLDWRKAVGSVMALDITQSCVGVAVAEHPEHNVYYTQTEILQPISLLPQQEGYIDAGVSRKRRIKKSQVVNKDLICDLEDAVRKHRVCGFVVNWPIHEGRMGEQCGKVLQVLDSIIDQSNSIVTRKRPFTLWCNLENASSCTQPQIDEWGRSSSFAQAPTYHEGMKYSSKSATRHEETNASLVAANVLDEWIKNHWEISARTGRVTIPKKTSKKSEESKLWMSNMDSVDQYTSEKASLQSALL